MEHEVVVIGAGIGGLTAAAVLAKHGLNVCLLERQSYAGGCAANVEHAGYQFEPTHGLYCGWEPEGIFDRLFAELAVTPPRAHLLSTPYVVRLPGGPDVPRITQREEIDAALAAAFPECADRAIAFYRDLMKASPNGPRPNAHLQSCSIRFRSFIDTQLQALAQCSGATCEQHILLSALDPQRSFWEIEGGALSLVDALLNSFRKSGGKLRLSSPVLRLAFGPDGSPVGVDLLNGERVFASRAIVSNLTIWDTYGKLIGPARTPRDVSTTLKSMSAFGSYQMFLTIKESAASALPAARMLIVPDLPGHESVPPEETRLSLYRSQRNAVKTSATEYPVVVSAHTNAEDWFSFHEDHSAFEERDRSMLEKTWARLHSALPELGAEVDLIETATPQTFYESSRRRFGMIGRPTPAATFLPASPFPSFLMVGDTAAGPFGLDGVAESASRAVRHLIQ